MKIVKVIGASIGVIVCFFYLGCGSVQIAEAAHNTNVSSLAIATKILPSAIVGTPYVAILDATGGTPGYTWKVTSGTLPSGLSLAAITGVISGTPTASGNFSFSVSLSDAAKPSQTKSTAMTISVAPPALAITPSALPYATYRSTYSQALQATGGIAPYKWSVSSGSLPTGLALASTGVISGVPTASGTSNFTATVQDSEKPAQKASLGVTIVVAAGQLQVIPSTLPKAVAGASYSQVLQASGGTPAYKWTITSGGLPAGLTLSSSGVISGIPVASGSSTFTASVSDSSSPIQTASATATIVAAPTPLAITASTLPSVIVGTAYSQMLKAAGGTAPYTWSITSGKLPAGLTLTSSTGAISGVPTLAGTSTFTATVVDSSSPAQAAAAASAVVVSPTALTITASTLPPVTVGTAYSQALKAAGGTTSYTWSITSGRLPAGLTLQSSSGTITGVPTASGVAAFTATVVDSSSPAQAASAATDVVVAPTLLTITSSALPSVTAGTAYSQTLQATGGSTPYTWSITSGKLPAGLTLAPSTGAITGVPTTSGTSTFTATVTDSSNPAQFASATAAVVVAPSASVTPAALAITTSVLPSVTAGGAYSQALQATGGTAPFSWSVTSGQLPTGLSISAAGIISGTPTASGTSSFTVTVTDGGSPAQTQSAALTIVTAAAAGQLTITSSTLLSGTSGTGYSQVLTASGGTPAYTWSISSGSLPSGLTLAATTGVISGTPASTGTSSFTATVHDNGSPVQTQSAATSITMAAAQQATGPGTWYVRPDGGTRYSTNVPTGLCDGTVDAVPVGAIPNQHCAFNDARMLWQDGSYADGGSTFPAWGWIGSGGDTYIIRGSIADGVSYRVGWPQQSTCITTDGQSCWGLWADAFAGIPSPPSGTAASHTRILGGNYGACTAQSARTQLHGGWGVWTVLSLTGASNVDVSCLDITDFSNCGKDNDIVACQKNGNPISDYAYEGIQFSNSSNNLTLTDIRVHGMASDGIVGPTGGGVVMTDLAIVGNADAGWNADDGSGTTGVGSLLVQNFDISWNGCVEEYPIVDPVPYFSCRDQSTGGYGDGFGTATVASPAPGWQVHFDNGTVSYNMQDGLDALHINGPGSSMAETRVLAYGNEGNQLKVGGAQATIQNSVIVGNCYAVSQNVIPGRPVPTQDSLQDACRAGDTAVLVTTSPGTPTRFQNNTIYSAGDIGLEFEYATGDTGSTNTLLINNNVFVGFNNPDNTQNPTPIYTTGDFSALTTNPGASWTNNSYYGYRGNWSCPNASESAAQCGNPGLTDMTWHPYGYGNMAPVSSSSPVVGAGVALPSITLDFTGTTRPNAPTIGAYEVSH